jgi:hypothetical protein
MTRVDIRGLERAELLAALYNHARPIGRGVLQAKPGSMTVDEARTILESGDDATRMLGRFGPRLFFDYVHGRPLKVDLGEDDLRIDLYDQDHGEGAAARIIGELRSRAKGSQ